MITPSWASLPTDLVVAIYAARTTQPDGPLVLGTKDRLSWELYFLNSG